MNFSERFRGYLPVVVDLETGGFDNTANPLLELACTVLDWQEDQLLIKSHHNWEIEPFAESTIDPASLKVTGIDLEDPLRNSVDEKVALADFFKLVRGEMKEQRCHRAIMVAHNASFDQGFLNAACVRCNLKRNPFHPFSTIDTASLAALAYGHTVLSEACRRAGLKFDDAEAHSALYDVERTASLFTLIVNAWEFPLVPGKQTG